MANTSKNVPKIFRQVKPLLSLDSTDARIRVRSLYKAWYRQIPRIIELYYMPYSAITLRKQLKVKFQENSHVKDLRIIDMLVVQGQQDLQEVVELWAANHHVLHKHFRENIVAKPKDFMSKFLSGQE